MKNFSILLNKFPRLKAKFCSSQEMNLFKEFQAACEQSTKCTRMPFESTQRKNCILECISPTCYKEIYAFDEVRNLVNFYLIADFNLFLSSSKTVKSTFDRPPSKDASSNASASVVIESKTQKRFFFQLCIVFNDSHSFYFNLNKALIFHFSHK